VYIAYLYLNTIRVHTIYIAHSKIDINFKRILIHTATYMLKLYRSCTNLVSIVCCIVTIQQKIKSRLLLRNMSSGVDVVSIVDTYVYNGRLHSN